MVLLLHVGQVLELVLTLREQGALGGEQLGEAGISRGALRGEVLIVGERPLAGYVVKVRRAPAVKTVLQVLEELSPGGAKVLLELLTVCVLRSSPSQVPVRRAFFLARARKRCSTMGT